MPSIHRVCVYLNLDYHGALELPCDEFSLALKHSIIDDLQKTEEGRKYLDDCQRLKQTDIDVSAFRKKAREQRKGG